MKMGEPAESVSAWVVVVNSAALQNEPNPVPLPDWEPEWNGHTSGIEPPQINIRFPKTNRPEPLAGTVSITTDPATPTNILRQGQDNSIGL